ncbi:MAG: hypothetical protein ACFE94_09835 [Candidatus Hodarchaeota archaeon]
METFKEYEYPEAIYPVNPKSKTRENGIVVYDSAEAAAKCIYSLWNYGNYL